MNNADRAAVEEIRSHLDKPPRGYASYLAISHAKLLLSLLTAKTHEVKDVRRAMEWFMCNNPGTPVPDWIDVVVNPLPRPAEEPKP